MEVGDPGRGVSKGRPGEDKVRPPCLDIRNVRPQRAQEFLLASFSLPQRGQIIIIPLSSNSSIGMPLPFSHWEKRLPPAGECSCLGCLNHHQFSFLDAPVLRHGEERKAPKGRHFSVKNASKLRP